MNKNNTRKSAVVKRNEADNTPDEDFTERVLMSLVVDVTQLQDTVERVKVQVYTLAKERGIEPPKE